MRTTIYILTIKHTQCHGRFGEYNCYIIQYVLNHSNPLAKTYTQFVSDKVGYNFFKQNHHVQTIEVETNRQGKWENIVAIK